MPEKLNSYQQTLVTDNLGLIDKIIFFDIKRNLSNPDYDYEDLYQTGCIALCNAAAYYNGASPFPSYARCVIRNGLINYCVKANRRGHIVSFDDLNDNIPCEAVSDCTIKVEEQMDMSILYDRFHEVRKRYSGVTLKGIDAMELQIRGFTGADIAQMYGVKPNQVSAWIVRAKQRLQADEEFLQKVC